MPEPMRTTAETQTRNDAATQWEKTAHPPSGWRKMFLQNDDTITIPEETRYINIEKRGFKIRIDLDEEGNVRKLSKLKKM